MIISLIGFMGCGKSSVGRRLSELLCCDFMDLDDVIESWTGKKIPEIFAEEGETGFRAIEAERLSTVIDGNAEMVLSLGGGTVMTPKCGRIVHEKTLCIYLRASVETLADNLKDESEGRPMLASGTSLHNRIAELLALRESTYESTAHIIIDTDGKTIDEIAEEIIKSIYPGA